MRHYCKFCGAKRNESKMVQLEFALLREKFWFCKKCVSATADISGIVKPSKKLQFVEFFSGSGNISKVARSFGWETTTIDIEPKYEPDICVDVMNLRRSLLPKNVDVVWISFPCYVFTVLTLGKHWEKIKLKYRGYYYSPKTEEAKEVLKLLYFTIEMLKKVNPLYYFIENPRGGLRHFPHLSLAPFRHTVSYADYGFDYPKPTDIWTNCERFKPIPCGSFEGMKFEKSVLDLSSSYERSLVPDDLIKYLFETLDFMKTT